MTLLSAYNLGMLLQFLGRPNDAVETLAPLEPAQRRRSGENPLPLARLLTALGRSRAEVGEFEAAQANLSESLAIIQKSSGAPQHYYGDVLTGMVRLYDSWNDREPGRGHDTKAAEWRKTLVEWQSTTQPAARPAPSAATRPAEKSV